MARLINARLFGLRITVKAMVKTLTEWYVLNIDVHVCAQVFNLDIAPVSLEDQVVGYN